MANINTAVQPPLGLQQQDQSIPAHAPQRSNNVKKILTIRDPVSHKDVPVTPREVREQKSAQLASSKEEKSGNVNAGGKALPKDGRVGTEKQVISIKRPENMESSDEKALTSQSTSLAKDSNSAANSHVMASGSEENGQLKEQTEEEIADSTSRTAKEPSSSKTSETPSDNQSLEGTAEKVVNNGKGGALNTNGSDTAQKAPSAESEEERQPLSKAGDAGEKNDALSTTDQGDPDLSEDKQRQPEKANGASYDSKPQLREEPKAESKSSEESKLPSTKKIKRKDILKTMDEEGTKVRNCGERGRERDKSG